MAEDNTTTFAAANIGSDPYSWSHTVGAGSDMVLIVAVMVTSSYDGADPTATYDGTAMTAITDSPPSPRPGVYVFRLVAPSTGSNTVEVQFDSAIQGAGIAVSWDGIDQTDPVLTGSPATATGFSTSPSVDVSSQSGDIVLDFVGVDDGADHGAPTDDESQSLATVTGSPGAGTVSVLAMASYEDGAATTTASWTTTNSDSWASVGISLTPSGGGGGGGNAMPMAMNHYRQRRVA